MPREQALAGPRPEGTSWAFKGGAGGGTACQGFLIRNPFWGMGVDPGPRVAGVCNWGGGKGLLVKVWPPPSLGSVFFAVK